MTADDKRIKVLGNTRKKGAPGARNTGVEHSKGEYIVFLDSDDLLAPLCLQNRIIKFHEHPEFDFLVFSTVEFKELIDDTNILLNVITAENTIERFLNMDVPWLSTGPIWRKSSLINTGLWNEELLSWQDWELHIRALHKQCKFLQFSTVDNYYRCSSKVDTLSRISINKEHIVSHLKMIGALKTLMKNNPAYTSRLNGLIYWIAEKAAEQGETVLAKQAIRESHQDLHISKQIVNLLTLFLFKKSVVKHPRMPSFGTYRQFFFKQ